MTTNLLQQLDESIRKSTNLNIDFGGLTVLLSGDFFQMPPVRSPVMYLQPTLKDGIPDKTVLGFNLWRKFDKVIYLDENNRFIKDPDWGKGCYFARKGIWLQEFVERINQKFINQSNLSNTSEINSNCSTQFVTPDNNLRYHINQKFISFFSKSNCSASNNNIPIRIAATFSFKFNKLGHTNQYLSKQDKRKIMSQRDDQLSRLAPFIDVIIGMPITITQNINTTYGICNGTFGKVLDIQFPTDTVFYKIRDAESSTYIYIPSKPPDVIIIFIEDGFECPFLKGILFYILYII
jgi:hypothetical protein